MPRKRLVELTERERLCLRLVRMHLTSKEIAREAELTVRQVDRALDSARTKLGAADRTKAALLLERMEGGEPYPGVPSSLSAIGPDEDDDGVAVAEAPVLNDTSQVFVHEPMQPSLRHPEDPRHDLIQLLWIALKLALLILAGIILAVVVLRTLSDVGRPHLSFSP